MNDNITEHFKELEYHLLNDSKPSIYLNYISNYDFFNKFPFLMLSNLKKIEQSPIHHPEGNVWNHTLMVVDNAASFKSLSKDPKALMWAALLHDIGKVPATKIRKGRITAYDHDKFGEEMAYRFLKAYTDDLKLIGDIVALVRWHMQILYVLKELPFANIEDMLNRISIKEVAILSYCDRIGRGNLSENKIGEEKNNIRRFISICNNYKRK